MYTPRGRTSRIRRPAKLGVRCLQICALSLVSATLWVFELGYELPGRDNILATCRVTGTPGFELQSCLHCVLWHLRELGCCEAERWPFRTSSPGQRGLKTDGLSFQVCELSTFNTPLGAWGLPGGVSGSHGRASQGCGHLTAGTGPSLANVCVQGGDRDAWRGGTQDVRTSADFQSSSWLCGRTQEVLSDS